MRGVISKGWCALSVMIKRISYWIRLVAAVLMDTSLIGHRRIVIYVQSPIQAAPDAHPTANKVSNATCLISSSTPPQSVANVLQDTTQHQIRNADFVASRLSIVPVALVVQQKIIW